MKKFHKRAAVFLTAATLAGLPAGAFFYSSPGSLTVWADNVEVESSEESSPEDVDFSDESEAEILADPVEQAQEDAGNDVTETPEVGITFTEPEGWQTDTATVKIQVEDTKNTGAFSIAKVEARLSENGGWSDITGALGMAAIAVACGFGLFGLWQLIKRRSLKRVDRDIYALAGLYIAIGIVYVLFEKAVVNYRPIDMGAGLEPSFPSSHTMLTCCIMSSAIWQFKRRIKSEALRKTTVMLCTAVMAVTIAGRLVSGVHWMTDIAGGVLISASLMAFYRAAAIR